MCLGRRVVTDDPRWSLVGKEVKFGKVCLESLTEQREWTHGANVKGETAPDYGISDGDGPFCLLTSRHELRGDCPRLWDQ